MFYFAHHQRVEADGEYGLRNWTEAGGPPDGQPVGQYVLLGKTALYDTFHDALASP